MSDIYKDFDQKAAIAKEKVNSSLNLSSTKKMLSKKSKTEKAEEEGEKKKINYKIKDDSDGDSDSGPSDDNLDSDEILKLIPKKYGNKKYLRGIEETKKKAPKTE